MRKKTMHKGIAGSDEVKPNNNRVTSQEYETVTDRASSLAARGSDCLIIAWNAAAAVWAYLGY